MLMIPANLYTPRSRHDSMQSAYVRAPPRQRLPSDGFFDTAPHTFFQPRVLIPASRPK